MNTKEDRPEPNDELPHPDVSHLVTEDEGPLLEFPTLTFP
jgi:hypothetical protein